MRVLSILQWFLLVQTTEAPGGPLSNLSTVSRHISNLPGGSSYPADYQLALMNWSALVRFPNHSRSFIDAIFFFRKFI
ncbi:hypothetical protein GOODEAATRI_018227 [Goodea atripinnis]|uniref:Secreted protein n=1 Tax=Goodea atripinnis TaxID=208336 RepID=A0ABV0PZR9_9TELE